jgi:hypothetical protein
MPSCLKCSLKAQAEKGLGSRERFLKPLSNSKREEEREVRLLKYNIKKYMVKRNMWFFPFSGLVVIIDKKVL